jgi:hypothetical protein
MLMPMRVLLGSITGLALLTAQANAAPIAHCLLKPYAEVKAVLSLARSRFISSKEGKEMSQPTSYRREPSDKMTTAGAAFLAISIVIGIGFGADLYSIVAGVAMLILLAAIYFAGR